MRIEIEHYGEKHIFESKSDDYNLTELAVIIKNLLIACGYSIEGINEIILTDDTI